MKNFTLRACQPWMTSFLVVVFFLLFVPLVAAQTLPTLNSTDSAVATSDAILNSSSEAEASVSALIQEKIQQKTETDITQPGSTVKSRLAEVLDSNPVGPLSMFNFLQYLIRQAVNSGVPANMLVLMLLFPVIVSFIAASRHIVGLEGFGVYGPAVLAVAFLSTGIVTGILLFLVITAVALVGRSGFRQMKLQYLPRTALLVWFVSLVIFLILLFSPYFTSLVNIASVGIFPILVLILLSENFIGSQISLTSSRLAQMTFETILLSAGAAWLMGLNVVQDVVILHPEFTIILVALIDILVGKYTGLRVSEYFRFKAILDQEE